MAAKNEQKNGAGTASIFETIPTPSSLQHGISVSIALRLSAAPGAISDRLI
jgi:hypothetical protein